MDSAARAVPGDLVAQGITPGDRIGLIVPDVPAFPVLFYAALHAGGIVVLMNPHVMIGELECHLHNSAMSLVYGWDGGGIAAHKGGAAIGIPSATVGAMGPEGLAGEPFRPHRPRAAIRTPPSSSTHRGRRDATKAPS
ncbi:AMP-binding protein [Streptomyces sp. NPDC059916]|uniref:AMP-binding protein n=1 Tax=Streptomyces sp. NPDC059916 TaxID=3347001 RepID=UPI0036BDC556